MAALSGQELDDSIFGTDSNLDWADEVNMTQPLNAEPFSNSAKPVKQKEYSEDPGSDPRRPSPTHPGSSTAKSHRDSADQRPARHQQPSGRQSRQDGRSSRNNRSESSSAYNNRAHSTTRASNSNASTTGTGGGGSRHRGGRSTSRSGYPPQGNFSHQPTGDQRPQQRAARDRSLSMERSGSIDRSRGWRGSTSSNRSRADRAERWEHDKFDAHPPAGGRGSRSRARRGSVTQEMPAPISAEMERIGKEGISHVTINRRESNASSRGQTASSHEVQRRGGGPENSLDERAGGMDVPRYAKGAQQQGGASSLGSNSAHLMSPRSPALAGFSSTGEPYRAPHRRQSSTDSHPAPVSGGSQVAATSPTNPASVPARKTSPQPTQPVLKQKQIQPIMASDDDGSSAEVEWENFVANGGLEMPLDRITDDLLRQPKQPKAHPTPSSSSGTGSQRRPSLSSGLAVDNLDLLPPVGLIVKQPRRPLVRLDDDGDTSDSAAGNGDSGGSEADRRDRVVSKQTTQGISIRGAAQKEAAQKAAANSARTDTGMSSLVLDQVIEPRTRRPSIPAAERLSAQRNAATPSPNLSKQQRKVSVGNGSDSLGIQIKGSTSSNGRSDVRAPSAPLRPSATASSRPTTPVKPASNVSSRADSRSSSNEGRTKPTGGTPTTYLRRQFEGYDEDRGKHIYSVNISYDDYRNAPIHVHEKDDVAKLAAKFARTWRVHNKEQKIKHLLIKMKTLYQEAEL